MTYLPSQTGGDVSLNAYSHPFAQNSGTPSSIAADAILDATLFKGAKVVDVNGGFKAISSDGDKTTVAVDNVANDSEMTTANVLLTNPRLEIQKDLIGDWSFSLRFDAPSNMGNAITHFGLLLGWGAVSGECHGVCARFGRWQTANGRNTVYYLVDTGGISQTASDAVSWTTEREIQVKRVGKTITASTRVGATDSWSAYSTKDLDVAGYIARASVVFYANANNEIFDFHGGALDGFVLAE
jgi:hypothetical protein